MQTSKAQVRKDSPQMTIARANEGNEVQFGSDNWQGEAATKPDGKQRRSLGSRSHTLCCMAFPSLHE